MKADDILKKHEDANEMHFHEVDRKWIIEAMEEYVALRQPFVSGELEAIRTDFCLWYYAQSQPLDAHKVVDWFASNLR
jgi:hypothetical protein